MSQRNNETLYHFFFIFLVGVIILCSSGNLLLQNDKINFDNIPKTIEDYISVTYRCNRFTDSYSFLSMSLIGLVINLNEDDFKVLKN